MKYDAEALELAVRREIFKGEGRKSQMQYLCWRMKERGGGRRKEMREGEDGIDQACFFVCEIHIF